jgi:hypothetical protein
MAIRSTRLKCSKHKVWLVLNFRIVAKPSGPVRIEYWSCPLLCGYVRARKDQKKPVRKRLTKNRLKVAPRPAKGCQSDDRQLGLSF